jgi:hypothetical protein
MCLCVDASDSTTAFDDPNFLSHMCRVHRALPKGVPGGARYDPLGYMQHSGQRPKKKNWAVFSIFSGFIN